MSENEDSITLSFAQHFSAVAILAAVSLGVAFLVAPKNPQSMMFATPPVFLLAIAAYLAGFRKGSKRNSTQD